MGPEIRFEVNRVRDAAKILITLHDKTHPKDDGPRDLSDAVTALEDALHKLGKAIQ